LPVVDRHCPVLISVLHGMETAHYKAHFMAFFCSLPYKDYDEFMNGFGGMTCDFAGGERTGFEEAVRSYYKVPKDQPLHMDRYYRCCEIHYRNSIRRFTVKSRMPLADIDDFGKSALELMGRHLARVDFDRLVATILAKYPQAKRWLQWHLNDNVGKFIFPALSVYDNSHITKDTNAQESLGNDFK
ncbi:hypothetical protein BGZ93_003944, partial [Podila epicladia]